MALAAMVGVAVGLSPIPFYTIGMFAPELSTSFGWSFAAMMASIALQSAVVVVVSPLAGAAVDRFGARPIAVASLILFGLAFMSLAVTPGSLWIFYAQWMIMSVAGAGTLSATWTRVVAGWFDRNLGLALGVASTGTGIAGFLLKPYGAWLIHEFGWRRAFVGIGLLPIVAVPIVAACFRERRDIRGAAAAVAASSASSESGVTVREAVRRPAFWLMAAAFLLISFALTAPTPNLENILRSLAFDRSAITRITSSFGLAVIAGRLVGGWLLDRVWAPLCALVFLLLPAAGCWLLAQTHVPLSHAAIAVITLGVAAGFEFDLLAFLASRYFGRRHYGAIYGCVYAVIAVGGGLGPVAFGRAFDMTASYSGALVVGAACAVAGGLLLLLMGPYPDWTQPRPDEAVRAPA